MTMYRYVCMAILLIMHRKPEKTVVDFKVTEWNDRQLSAGVGATITFRGGADRVVITTDEDKWLGAYFAAIRPLYLQRQDEPEDDQGCFFLGTTGLPIANPRADLHRLWRHCQKICEGVGPNPPSGTAEAAGTSSGGQSSASAFDNKWDAFLTQFPITIGALAPSKDDMVSAGFGEERKYYFMWRRMQLEKRVLHVSDVLQAWVSPLKAPIEEDEDIVKSVMEQRWKGISLKNFGQPKGKGVIATMPFSRGDVVCDYHGKLISEAEGKKKMENMEEGAMCYLFFVRGRHGTKMCVDSQTFPCECHPGKDTFGRRMNHSGKNFNVKPVVFQLHFPDGAKDTALFLATKDTAVNEELRWDYGVRRSSFKGEGMDLEWLDE